MSRVWILALLGASLSRAVDLSIGPTQAGWAVLDHALRSNDVDHRQQALAALATIPGAGGPAVKRVEEALRDKSTRVRASAASALGQMKATSAIPALKAALVDDGEVAFAAAKALADMNDPSGREVLIAVLAGDRSAVPGPMTNAIREAKKRVKNPEGLALLGIENAAGTMFAPAGMAITAAKDALDLKSKGAPGRAAAAAYLAKDSDPYSVMLLEWALNDDSRFVRIEAAKGLGARGNAGSVPKLEKLLDDPHTAVRCMAAAAIIRLTEK